MQEKLPLHLLSSHNKHWMKFMLQALAVESLAPQQKRLNVSLGTSHRGISFILWINRSFGSTKRKEAGVFLPHANLSCSPSSENCSLTLQRILSTWVTICFCFILTVQTITTITLDAEGLKIIYAFIIIISYTWCIGLKICTSCHVIRYEAVLFFKVMFSTSQLQLLIRNFWLSRKKYLFGGYSLIFMKGLSWTTVSHTL